MAVNKEMLKRSLTINVNDGLTTAGAVKSKAHTYGGVKMDAQADKLYQAGDALGGLMKQDVVNIVLTEKSELADEL